MQNGFGKTKLHKKKNRKQIKITNLKGLQNSIIETDQNERA